MSFQAGRAFDYDYLQEFLANALLRNLWNKRARKKFLHEFATAPALIDDAIPPFVGVGTSESEETRSPQLELFATFEAGALNIDRLLSERNWDSARLNITTTGIIHTCTRPVQGGDSIGRPGGPTGTCACLVEDAQTIGRQYLLTCNHVVAGLNKGRKMKDEVWQPSEEDGGSMADRIGILANFKRISFGSESSNLIDAAICKPDHVNDIRSGLRRLGPVLGYVPKPQLNTAVKKEGRSSGVTRGKLRLKNLTHIVRYDSGEEAIFEEQLGIIGTDEAGPFATRGDSGALVIDESGNAVGLLFAVAGGVDISFANPIKTVLDEFRVKLA
jgi:hypothetical protein